MLNLTGKDSRAVIITMPKEVTETILKEAKEGMMAMSRNRNIDIEIREIIDKEKIDKYGIQKR